MAYWPYEPVITLRVNAANRRRDDVYRALPEAGTLREVEIRGRRFRWWVNPTRACNEKNVFKAKAGRETVSFGEIDARTIEVLAAAAPRRRIPSSKSCRRVLEGRTASMPPPRRSGASPFLESIEDLFA
jgi:hypothetical protein